MRRNLGARNPNVTAHKRARILSCQTFNGGASFRNFKPIGRTFSRGAGGRMFKKTMLFAISVGLSCSSLALGQRASTVTSHVLLPRYSADKSLR